MQLSHVSAQFRIALVATCDSADRRKGALRRVMEPLLAQGGCQDLHPTISPYVNADLNCTLSPTRIAPSAGGSAPR
jgi:hypothetical protein